MHEPSHGWSCHAALGTRSAARTADGASTVVDGLYFVGVPFMRTAKSPLLLGVGEDAAVVARTIAGGATVG